MPFERMLADLFQEEDRARDWASRLMQTAQMSPRAVVGERESLIAFLNGPMELHMSYEERFIFPSLVKRGLGPEVQVAEKQHETVRQMAAKLRDAQDEDVAQIIFDTARLLLHHTNFECDYIYPELDKSAWIELMKETAEQKG